MIKFSAWGYLDLTLLGLEVNGMQVPNDNRIIHGVFGISILPGRDVMCACDHVKECESVDHDWNELEIREITTQMLSIWHHSKQ